MARPEVTYQKCVEAGLTMGEAMYRENAAAAVAQVDYLVGANEVTDEAKYLEAVVAAMRAYAGSAATGAGFSIGSFSMGADPGGRTAQRAARDAAYEVLATTGMVYAGLA